MPELNQEKPTETSEFSAVGFSASPKPLIPEKFFAPNDGEKFVVFFLNDKLYALAAAEVAEVTQTLSVALLPNAPEWVFGIANLRGEIITVLDLSKIFHEEAEKPANKSKFVILNSKQLSAAVAFGVERISEIVALTDEKIEKTTEKRNPHIFGKAAHKLGVLHLINAEKMLDALAS